MKSSIPIGNGTNGTNAVDMVDTNGHGAANGKNNGHSNGHSNGHGFETHHEKAHMNGNGVTHTNGHSETGISKSEFNLLFLFFCYFRNFKCSFILYAKIEEKKFVHINDCIYYMLSGLII